MKTPQLSLADSMASLYNLSIVLADVMDALQYIIMRLGSDVSSSINEYVNKVPTLAEKFKRLDNLHSSNEINRKNFTNNDGLL
jgi:hypothetical protein